MKAICRKSNNTVVDCQKQTMLLLIILSWDADWLFTRLLDIIYMLLNVRVEHRDIKNICEKDMCHMHAKQVFLGKSKQYAFYML